jgi:hypothetical protein
MEEALGRALNNTAYSPEVKIGSGLGYHHNGDVELRTIARAGRKWKMTIGRKVDMESEWSL